MNRNHATIPIFTLNARDNVLLQVFRKQFAVNSDVMHREIQTFHRETLGVLTAKHLDYRKFKSALVPRTERHEAGFIFDSRRIADGWYGPQVARMILPLLERRSAQSVLHGDLLGQDQDLIFEVLNRYMRLARSFTFTHGSDLYCVYVNNLSLAALDNMHRGLCSFDSYLGYVPGSFQTIGKSYISTTVGSAFLKCGSELIMCHEDDRPGEEDVNTLGYPFEDFGYRARSLPSRYFDVFLSYKIERGFKDSLDTDTEMSINALTREVHSLDSFEVRIDAPKFAYLRAEKFGKLKQGQIHELEREELEALIKEKVSASYIYNLTFLPEHGVIKFDVMVEILRGDGGYPARIVAALEYMPSTRILRLITMT